MLSGYNRRKTSLKSGTWLLAAVLFLSCLSPMSVHAAGARVMSTVVSEDSMYTYIKGVSDIQSDSSVQIGNTVCDSADISAAKIADLETPIRTLFLIDNSQSIPDGSHETIQNILQDLIESAMAGEQFRIGTVSDDVQYLCEFTDDIEILNSVIGSLSYQDQDTYLSDVLYNVISELRAENTYVYTRIVVISDGADDKAIGYTNDEVRSLIENNPYPVYTIGIPASGNDSELETMFSFSRASSADYILLDGETSVEDVVSILLEDQNNYCIRVNLDQTLQDGSSKSVLLKVSTSEGMVELTTRVDMPFGTGITTEETEEEESEEEQGEDLPVLEITPVSEEEQKSGSSVPLWLLTAVGVLMVLAAIFACFLLLRKKKTEELLKQQEEEKKRLEQEAEERIRKEKEREIQKVEEPEESAIKDTVYDREEIEDKYTYGLWDRRKGNYYLLLTNLDNPDIRFKKPIKEEISIGRENTDIVITGDDRVSRNHCKVILRGHLLYLKDMDSKNGTFYQDTRIYEETPIVSGGKIKIGRYRYSIELVME